MARLGALLTVLMAMAVCALARKPVCETLKINHMGLDCLAASRRFKERDTFYVGKAGVHFKSGRCQARVVLKSGKPVRLSGKKIDEAFFKIYMTCGRDDETGFSIETQTGLFGREKALVEFQFQVLAEIPNSAKQNPTIDNSQGVNHIGATRNRYMNVGYGAFNHNDGNHYMNVGYGALNHNNGNHYMKVGYGAFNQNDGNQAQNRPYVLANSMNREIPNIVKQNPTIDTNQGVNQVRTIGYNQGTFGHQAQKRAYRSLNSVKRMNMQVGDTTFQDDARKRVKVRGRRR